jgi:hypothetical protein
VVESNGLCLDIDSGTDKQIFEALSNFKSFEYALHSTHSHHKAYALKPGTEEQALDEEGNPYLQTKIRAVFPLSRPVTPEEYESVWLGFAAMANGLQDKKTKAVSHPFYLPAAPEGAKVLLFHNQGTWIDPDEIKVVASSDMALADGTDEDIVEETAHKIFALLRRVPKDHELRDAATALAKGEPFAQPGERHDIYTKLTGYLAYKTLKRPLSPKTIERIFKESIVKMQAADSSCDGIEAIVTAYETAHEKAAMRKEKARLAEQKETLGDDDFRPWSEQEIEGIKKQQNTKAKRPVFIVQKDRAHYVVERDGYFSGPYSEKDMQVNAFQQLAASPVELYDSSGDGYRPKNLTELVRHNGEVAEKIVADLATQRTWYDKPKKTLREALCPLRTDALGGAHFNEHIDEWLKLFTGHYYEKVQDWMACAPDLNKLLCALTLAGDPGTGKTLFAQGIASLWSEGGAASPPECIVGKYNEELTKCPLVFADETLPRSWQWESVTTKLRAEIASMTRSLSRKYYAPIGLHGAIRFILATNNPMVLSSNVATAADLHAIAQRFLYIETDKKAEAFLAKFPFEVKDKWRTEGIARHCLWLQENRQVQPEGRFWIVGDVSRMHRLLVTSSDWNSWVCEWIVNGLRDGFRKSENNSQTTGHVAIRNGKLFVNTNAITAGWTTYTNYPNVNPDPRRVATALRSIAKSPKAIQLTVKQTEGGEYRNRFFEIDMGHITAWAEEQGTAETEELMKAVQRGVQEAPQVVNLDGTPHVKG